MPLERTHDATTTSALDSPTERDPHANLTPDEYEAAANAILHGVNQGLVDPLTVISEETEQDLVRLAMHDTLRTERLERRIQQALRDSNQGEAVAKAFTLTTFRKSAREKSKALASEAARAAKLRARNLKIVGGGKDEGLEVVSGLSESAGKTEKEDLYSNSAHLQAGAWLRVNRKGRIWYDTFANNFFTDWDGTTDDRVLPAKAVDDAFLLNVHTTLHRLDVRLAKSSFGNSERAIHSVGFEDRRNEPRDWIKGLEWDREPRLERMLHEAYGTPPDDYHKAVGRCWFVSMASRIMQPGSKVHTMPVFVGDQGYLKSTALEIIGGKWYGIINVGADKQNDFVGAMAGLVVAEIAELDAISGRRVENSRVKTLLSTAEDRYRPPYGRTTQVFKRTAVLAGTTNDSGWHRDETGARRFWTVICSRPVDVEWLKANREQLFAEALWRLSEGENWWDVPRAEQERLAMAHYATDPWEERIEQALATSRLYTGRMDCTVAAAEGDPNALDMDAHWGTLVTTSRIMTQWLQLPVSQQTHRTSLQVARVMRKLGWDSRTVRVNSRRTKQAWIVCDVRGAAGADTGQKELELQ